jgi:uncharacterized protein YceK
MKLKSTIAIVIAAALLAGCASTQMQTIDGKQVEVFKGGAGTYSKAGATMSDFNDANSACQIVAFKDESGNNLGRVIPFNVTPERKYVLAVADQTATCLQAAGFTLHARSDGYMRIKAKLDAETVAQPAKN